MGKAGSAAPLSPIQGTKATYVTETFPFMPALCKNLSLCPEKLSADGAIVHCNPAHVKARRRSQGSGVNKAFY